MPEALRRSADPRFIDSANILNLPDCSLICMRVWLSDLVIYLRSPSIIRESAAKVLKFSSSMISLLENTSSPIPASAICVGLLQRKPAKTVLCLDFC